MGERESGRRGARRSGRYGLKPPYQICIATSATRDAPPPPGRTIEDVIDAHTADRAKAEAKSNDDDDATMLELGKELIKTSIHFCCLPTLRAPSLC